MDQLQEEDETTEKSHLAMGGVTEADRLPGFVPQQSACAPLQYWSVLTLSIALTGEEGWTLLKAVRCKLFEFGPDKNWHEAGTGMLRLLRDRELDSRYRLGAFARSRPFSSLILL